MSRDRYDRQLKLWRELLSGLGGVSKMALREALRTLYSNSRTTTDGAA